MHLFADIFEREDAERRLANRRTNPNENGPTGLSCRLKLPIFVLNATFLCK
jgi:hypothetical protein